MEIFATVIPFITFGLGVYVTQIFQKKEKKKKLMEFHANELIKSARTWYNQIHELNCELQYTDDLILSLRKHEYYLQNRLALPQLTQSILILQKFKQTKILVSVAKGFHQIILNYSAESKDESVEQSHPGFNDLLLLCPPIWKTDELKTYVEDQRASNRKPIKGKGIPLSWQKHTKILLHGQLQRLDTLLYSLDKKILEINTEYAKLKVQNFI